MEADQINWDILNRLRRRFLQGGITDTPYWQSPQDLANYDATYAQRIAWKWLAVIRELRQRRWLPGSSTLIDWGCGSGIASRVILSEFKNTFRTLVLSDVSVPARHYAAAKAKTHYPSLEIQACSPTEAHPEGSLLLVSHVLNELNESSRKQLLRLALQSREILWVEPGTHRDSHALLSIREQLLPYFNIIAPCPCPVNHCPMLLSENQTHWCHQFASPPLAIQADSNWVRFAQQATIDLRSLPYCYLAMQRNTQKLHVYNHDSQQPKDIPARIIGRPGISKVSARLLACTPQGLQNLEISKREHPDYYKLLKKNNEHPLYHIIQEGVSIKGIRT